MIGYVAARAALAGMSSRIIALVVAAQPVTYIDTLRTKGLGRRTAQGLLRAGLIDCGGWGGDACPICSQVIRAGHGGSPWICR